MGIFGGDFNCPCIFPHLYCKRNGLIEISASFSWLSPLNTLSFGRVAFICVGFLALYSCVLYGVMQICEQHLKTAFWRLCLYIPFAFIFLASFGLALVLFPQQKVLVMVLFFSYNLVKIGYGAYKSSVTPPCDEF